MVRVLLPLALPMYVLANATELGTEQISPDPTGQFEFGVWAKAAAPKSANKTQPITASEILWVMDRIRVRTPPT
jgi:hypothetical protein